MEFAIEAEIELCLTVQLQFLGVRTAMTRGFENVSKWQWLLRRLIMVTQEIPENLPRIYSVASSDVPTELTSLGETK